TQGDATIPPWQRSSRLLTENLMSAFAWKSTDVQNLREMASSGQDPIASLGYDGPLAPLSLSRQNLADYFKEQVAVVTNPAIDREREAEHFSTRVFIGPRPNLRGALQPVVELALPLLLGGTRQNQEGDLSAIGRRFGTCTLENLLAQTGGSRSRSLNCTMKRSEALPEALARLTNEAVTSVRRGVRLLLLDDSSAFTPTQAFLDPALVVAVLHKALKETTTGSGEALRRRVAIVVRSGALRNLHDLIFAYGMGADALCPYLMWEQAAESEQGVENLLGVLARGLEKVISTMGTHEIGGYGKYFASIGLCSQLAAIFETPNFCGSASGGLTLELLQAENKG
ncbi:MAG: glutamate synthase central domain-containing protein, partial [Desulfuromonadales bacterium]|nr:glutamate synthase central domain-containing protein [Desulfuromonadales bacterium]